MTTATKMVMTLEELLMAPSVQRSINYHANSIALEDRQDMIQEFYLAIVRAYDNIQDKTKAVEFCHTAIRNRKFLYYRDKQYKSRTLPEVNVEAGSEEEVDKVDMFASSEDINYEFKEFQINYENIRSKLSNSERKMLDAIILERKFALGGHGDVSHIADQLGYTKAYVSKTIRKLKDLLN